MPNTLTKEIQKLLVNMAQEYEFLDQHEPIQPRLSFHRLTEEYADKLEQLISSKLKQSEENGRIKEWMKHMKP